MMPVPEIMAGIREAIHGMREVREHGSCISVDSAYALHATAARIVNLILTLRKHAKMQAWSPEQRQLLDEVLDAALDVQLNASQEVARLVTEKAIADAKNSTLH